MANLLDSIIDYLADAVVKDTNGDAELNDLKLKLDTTAQAGTTDGDLYAAITALGWESDIVDAVSDVVAKKAMTKVMEKINQVTEAEILPITTSVANSITCLRIGCVAYFKVDNINNLERGENFVVNLPAKFKPQAQALIAFDAPNASTNRFRLQVTQDKISIYNYASSAITSSTNASIAFTWLAQR